MAAPAGGGGSAVSVLAPNGRRHTVKVTPSTVLLQVRPPARVGNGRTGGQAEGPRWPRPGPPLRLLPGCGAGPGPGGRRLRQPMGAFRAAARPIPWLGPGGGAGCSEAPFLSPGTAGDLTTPRPCCWSLRRLSEFSLLGHREEGRPCLLRSGASLRTLDRPRPCARK